MPLTSGFFNSVNGDRTYDATQMSSIFEGILRDGVFMSIGDKLMVTANTGMSIIVGDGRAWFDQTWTNLDAPMVLTVPNAEVLLNRIDAVVLEVNLLPETRANTIKIVKGSPGSNPSPPAMIKINGLYQYPLAYISVAQLATTIIQANITNKVGTSDCPFSTGILETMNIDALVTQWGSQWNAWINETQQAEDVWTAAKHAEFLAWMGAEKSSYYTWADASAAEFLAWFNTMQGQLSTDSAGNLQQQINDMKTLQSMGGMY